MERQRPISLCTKCKYLDWTVGGVLEGGWEAQGGSRSFGRAGFSKVSEGEWPIAHRRGLRPKMWLRQGSRYGDGQGDCTRLPFANHQHSQMYRWQCKEEESGGCRWEMIM
jgi:hypothetical protein